MESKKFILLYQKKFKQCWSVLISRNHSITCLISFSKSRSNQRSIVSVYGPQSIFSLLVQLFFWDLSQDSPSTGFGAVWLKSDTFSLVTNPAHSSTYGLTTMLLWFCWQYPFFFIVLNFQLRPPNNPQHCLVPPNRQTQN